MAPANNSQQNDKHEKTERPLCLMPGPVVTLTGQLVKVAKRHCSFMRSVFEATSDVDGCTLFMGTFPELVGFVMNGQSGFNRKCFPII